MKPFEIIDKLNVLLREQQDLGETFIDVLIDSRDDEGLPPLTADELATAQAKCDANAERANEIDEEISALKIDYMTETGKWPVYVDACIPYYREPWRFEK